MCFGRTFGSKTEQTVSDEDVSRINFIGGVAYVKFTRIQILPDVFVTRPTIFNGAKKRETKIVTKVNLKPKKEPTEDTFQEEPHAKSNSILSRNKSNTSISR